MNTVISFRRIGLLAVVACALALPARAILIVNGGFESGFTGWTRGDQIGSDGTFFLQTGTDSPANSFPVPAPPQGTTAAMTDAGAPGGHVLYQDFVVPTGLADYLLEVSLFINNNATDFFTPNTLDFSTPALNQRARVDIMKPTADPFSLAASDVLQNLFETKPGDPLTSGYNNMSFNISALMQANQGGTLRLRFSDIDNVGPFNLGVDNVDIQQRAASQVPDTLPGYMAWITVSGLVAVGTARRRAEKTIA